MTKQTEIAQSLESLLKVTFNILTNLFAMMKLEITHMTNNNNRNWGSVQDILEFSSLDSKL